MSSPLQHLSRAAHELRQIDSCIHQPVDQREYPRRAPFGHQLQNLGIELVVHQAQHLAHPLGGDRTLAKAEALVQHRQCVAHAAVGVAGNEDQRVIVGRNLLRRRAPGAAGPE